MKFRWNSEGKVKAPTTWAKKQCRQGDSPLKGNKLLWTVNVHLVPVICHSPIFLLILLAEHLHVHVPRN